MGALLHSLEGKRVAVVVGSGGVGKTSVSAAIALSCAMEGGRALVCTIDPARRLATALGLLTTLAHAQMTPVGAWKTIDDETKVEKSVVRITDTGGVLSGKIEKITDPAKQGDKCEKCTEAEFPRTCMKPKECPLLCGVGLPNTHCERCNAENGNTDNGTCTETA